MGIVGETLYKTSFFIVAMVYRALVRAATHAICMPALEAPNNPYSFLEQRVRTDGCVNIGGIPRFFAPFACMALLICAMPVR
jgi:hypothetical protein